MTAEEVLKARRVDNPGALQDQLVELPGFRKLLEKQDGDLMCWAAVAAIISKFLVHRSLMRGPVSQCTLAVKLIGGNCKVETCGTTDCDQTKEVEDAIKFILDGIGIRIKSASKGPSDIGVIIDQVKIGLPLVCEENSGTHAVLLYGYASNEQVIVGNPKCPDTSFDRVAFDELMYDCATHHTLIKEVAHGA